MGRAMDGDKQSSCIVGEGAGVLYLEAQPWFDLTVGRERLASLQHPTMEQHPELDLLEERPPAWIGDSSLARIWRSGLLGFERREETVNRLRWFLGKRKGAFGMRAPWREGFGARLSREGRDLARPRAGKMHSTEKIEEGGAGSSVLRRKRVVWRRLGRLRVDSCDTHLVFLYRLTLG